MVGRVVEPAHVDAVGGAHAGTELAADALLHAVLVAAEDVAAVLAGLLGVFLVGILAGHPRPGQVLEGQLEPAQEAEIGCHQPLTSGVAPPRLCSPLRAVPTEKARKSRAPTATSATATSRPHQPQIKTAATMSSQPSERGMSTFQPRSIS